MTWKNTLKKKFPTPEEIWNYSHDEGDLPNSRYLLEQGIRETKENREQENQKTRNMTRQERESYPLYLKTRKGLDSLPSTIKRKKKYKEVFTESEQILQTFLDEGEIIRVYAVDRAIDQINMLEKLQ